MRLSTSMINHNNVSSILKKQTELYETSQQLGTGKKILTPSDDPVGSGLAFNAKNMLANIEQYGKNIEYAEKSLRTAESTLEEIHNRLSRVRQLAVQANNDTLGNEGRHILGTEINQITSQIAALMNKKDEVGNHIFAGSKATTEPFELQSDGSYVYKGDEKEKELRLSDDAFVAATLSGKQIFANIESGHQINSYAYDSNSTDTTIGVSGSHSFLNSNQIGDYVVEKTAGGVNITGPKGQSVAANAADLSDLENYLNSSTGNLDLDDTVVAGAAVGDKFIIQANNKKEDMLTGLQRLADTLQGYSGETYQEEFLAQASDITDRWMINVERARTDIGVRRNGIESVQGNNESTKLFLQEHVSTLEDVDYAEAVGRFKLEQTALQASQQAFSMISNMSLFNFIR